ncbi:MAG: DCC1-like thiol-disulfide oxidoreductase family protein [Sulfurovum sp.]|nr:DCC1-like thiol-disulfide oxidoreductase family protein [Sulfurovum sp.]
MLKLCHHLGGMCKLMALFYLVPRIIRDFIYDMIAKYRYRIFGKRDFCELED